MISITVHNKSDEIVNAAKELVAQTAPITWVLLFEGDRWRYVKRVAIATQDATPVGIASVCPHDEEDDPTSLPTIMGVWVHPNHRNQAIGLRLVKACVKEAQELFSATQVIIEGVSPAGLRLAGKSHELGLPLLVKGAGLVPLP